MFGCVCDVLCCGLVCCVALAPNPNPVFSALVLSCPFCFCLVLCVVCRDVCLVLCCVCLACCVAFCGVVVPPVLSRFV
jgi:hypothetical protein